MIALRLVLAFVWTTYLIDSINTFECCDVLNNKSKSDNCKCSDQTGGVGTCICTTLPNTRSTWLCKKDANGDSVNKSFFKIK